MKHLSLTAPVLAAAIAFLPATLLPAAAQPSQAAYTLYSRLAKAMDQCWFGTTRMRGPPAALGSGE
ncbi:MAG: hypothetical protein RLT05_18055 [Bauldia litoralis]